METDPREILEKEDLPLDYEKIPTYANAVFRVGEHAILKIYESADRWNNTVRMYGLISQNGLAAPRILGKGEHPLPYLVMELLEGNPIGESRTQGTYRSFGEWVGRLHQIRFDLFGGLQEEGVGAFHETGEGPFSTWNQMHLSLATHRMKGFERTVMAPLVPAIIDYFSSFVYPHFQPQLIHEDLNRKNIFVQDEKITGVIDPDEGYVGCAEEELMRIELAHFGTDDVLKAAFFEGYLKHSELLEGHESRKQAFLLSRLLVETRCLLDLDAYKADRKEQALQETYDQIAKIIDAPREQGPAA